MINVGLIGFGLSGRVFHAPFIVADEGMALSLVFSSRTQEVLSAYPQVKLARHIDDVLLSKDLDLIVITSPNALHFSQAKAALEAGKHVLLEKPSVTKQEQIEGLTALAEQNNLVFCVYQNRRFDGDFLRLKALLQSKQLGELKQLESRFDRFRPNARMRWRELPGEGTGIFWDLGPHLLDQALHLLGTPDWINASIDRLRDDSQTHDSFELELGYKGHRVKLGSSPFEAGRVMRFNARFTGGSWQCHGLDPQEEALRKGQLPNDSEYAKAGVAQHFALFQATQHDVDQITETKERPNFGDYGAFYKALRLSIQGEGATPVSHTEACELVYALNLALESDRLGQRLVWSY
ncbi:Gfo/Idh/MocA family oxidoreductase [Marinomonas balearica]|uniref:Putative dehydrogenase n=1 Tax=Marinomonas balearica TaxID=491947 RepID=A0A4R6M817_9GAMM|nr:Gfo/Idh/MocA family oxidoreductase [Marinomonas balearica]TDO97474.1 putative dehydrogenase [Marinomonas balearica]